MFSAIRLFLSWTALAMMVGTTTSFLLLPALPAGRPATTTATFRELVLHAKPPPSAAFDLQAIEFFESQLDQGKMPTDDGDWDVGDDDNDEETTTSATIIKSHVIPPELDNMRIDAAIASLEPQYSRSFCGNLVTEGRVYLISPDSNNKKEPMTRKSFKVQAGQALEIHIPDSEKATEIAAENIPLDILYEDEHMIVISKAANMVVHPAAGNWHGTVVNALAYYLQNSPYGRGEFVDSNGQVQPKSQDSQNVMIQMEGTDGETVSFRPGIVHRLDKGTTGVLVVAKTTAALAALSHAFATRQVQKTYLAITVGNPGKRVTIDKPIGRHPIHRQRMRVVPDPHKSHRQGMAPKDRLLYSNADGDDRSSSPSQDGRRALSYVDTIAFDGKLSLVQVQIATGRTHQIRVHLQDRHTPIYGDDVYGLSDWNKRLVKTHAIERPLLHAYKLKLNHPVTGEPMEFRATLPVDMLQVAKAIYPQGEMERPDLFVTVSADA